MTYPYTTGQTVQQPRTSMTSAFLPTKPSTSTMVQELAVATPRFNIPKIETGITDTSTDVFGNVGTAVAKQAGTGISNVGNDIATANQGSSFGDLLNNEFAISNIATLGGLAANLLGYSDRKRAMEQQLAQGQVDLEDARSDSAFKRAKRANLNNSTNV